MLVAFLKKHLVRIVVLLILAGGVFWILGHNSKPAMPPPLKRGMGAVPVAVATAKHTDLPITISALGTVTPIATVTVKTQISGQLTQVAYTEGQLVHKGDFLAQIDPRPYQAQLEQYQGQLQRDQAQLHAAEID